jgi:hypothetical protein
VAFKAPTPEAAELLAESHAELLETLSENQFQGTPAALKRHIMAFYGDNPRPSAEDRKRRKRWARVERALKELRASSGRRAAAGVE